jgi:hypothetical protein
MIFLILLVLLLLAGAGVWIITIAVKSAFRPTILTRENIGYVLTQLLYALALALGTAAIYAIDKQAGLPIEWYHVLGLGSIVGLFFGIKYDLKGVALLGMTGSYFAIGGWIRETANYDLSAGVIIGGILLLSLLYDQASQQLPHTWIKKAFQIISLLVTIGTTLFLTTSEGLEAIATNFWFPEGIAIQGLPITNSTLPILNGPSNVLILLGLLLVAIVISTIIYFRRKGFSPSITSVQAITILIALVASGANEKWHIFSNPNFYPTELSSTGIGLAFFFNITAFALFVIMLWRGFNQKSIWQINLSLIALVLLVVIRYFDLLLAFMEKGFLFLSGGVLLLLIGFFVERARKKLLARMEERV